MINKSIFTVILVSLLSFGLFASEADGYYEKGITAQEQQNYELAIKWLTKAAEERHTDAKFKLAKIYQSNPEFKDIDMAYYWYRAGAYNANPQAQFEMAKLIEEGDFFRRGKFEAYVWYRVSAHFGGLDKAAPEIERFAKLYTATENEVSIIDANKKIFQIEEAMARSN